MKNSIKVSDNRTMETKQASQTVTVSHTEKDNAMGSLQPMLEYSENGFYGLVDAPAREHHNNGGGKRKLRLYRKRHP